MDRCVATCCSWIAFLPQKSFITAQVELRVGECGLVLRLLSLRLLQLNLVGTRIDLNQKIPLFNVVTLL